jgi:hypothetical protein
MAPQSQIKLSSSILKAEQTFQDKLPKGPTHTTLSSWIQIIQTSIQFLNSISSINLTHCFLCASLQRPLLVAVPVNLSISTQPLRPKILDGISPLSSVPLLEADSEQSPFYTCYLIQRTLSKTSLLNSCLSNVSITTQTPLPSGLYFWCNDSLHTCINASILSPCLLVIVAPQLTLYGKAEFSWLYSPDSHRLPSCPSWLGLVWPPP